MALRALLMALCAAAMALCIAAAAAALPPCYFAQDCQDFPCNSSALISPSDLIAYLGEPRADLREFHDNMERAAAVIRSFGAASTEPKIELHTTLAYLCCYSLDELARIRDALLRIDWPVFYVQFERIGCNGFHRDNLTHVDFFALLSDESNAAMQQWIAALEANITALSGVPIHKPRRLQTPFHSTLASVAVDFPVAEALDAIRAQIPQIMSKPVPVRWFLMDIPLEYFSAKDSDDAAPPARWRPQQRHRRRRRLFQQQQQEQQEQ